MTTLTLPKPPAEVPQDADLSKLAPKFRAKVEMLLVDMANAGHDPVVFEAFRSDERAAYLYGFGREYDDGRGIVTNAPDGSKTWHRFGLAVDIISQSKQWDAPTLFWNDLRTMATALGLVPGGSWTRPDLPHAQWGAMRVTPSAHAWELLQDQGIEAVWREVGATDAADELARRDVGQAPF